MTCTSSNHFSSKKGGKGCNFYIQDHQSQENAFFILHHQKYKKERSEICCFASSNKSTDDHHLKMTANKTYYLLRTIDIKK